MESHKEVIISMENGVRLVKFNRPHKKNAISFNMYKIIIDILNEDAKNDEVVLTVITGTGNYYSSGVDLKSKYFSSSQKPVSKKTNLYLQFIDAFIRYPKLLIAVVNGPAIGIAVTTLALCDVVYASDCATFSTPFLNFSLPPEGCSSYMFPRIMGKTEEALKFNFISKIFPHEHLENQIKELLNYGMLNRTFITNCKKLINNNIKNTLLEINLIEESAMEESYRSGAVTKSIKAYFNEKSKL
ncbi:hypothetical protein RN001_010004 [Aquatica leii]|uniref:Enoyl-CoA delta isomerase 2, mitochondrial n=1 Tax=Aquatica leii TaxID=1421715 RepID=A0AAN7SN36_9COLE|nr:hypothetical protein RN001_010004 [Aquatica leii]